MNPDWEQIFTATQLQQAEMMKAILAQSEIQAVIINKQDSLYKLGDIQLFVKRDDVLRALQIINRSAGE